MPTSVKFLHKLAKHFGFSSRQEGREVEDLEQIAAQEQKSYDFEELSHATNKFDPANKLGQGGFGSVYKGKLRGGREIAVKMLSQNSKQGNREFKMEAKLLARAQHRNVVTLLGYCVHDSEKLLVYEYVSNGSLDKLLFNSERRDLSWKRRFDIIRGVARGLLYLHEDSHSIIIHRDIKASNILLDDNWVPKIADFGMARLFLEDLTHVNTRVAGTNGYMAPEYVTHGRLSVKADVFSFGVVVLELITGHKNWAFNLDPGSRNLLDWVYKMYRKDRSLETVDPLLASSADPDQVSLCIHIGLLCTQGDPQLRPTMRRVIVMLSKRPKSMPEPTRPGFPGSRNVRPSNRTQSSSSDGRSEYYSSHNFEPMTSGAATSTATTSTLATPKQHSRGKQPMV